MFVYTGNVVAGLHTQYVKLLLPSNAGYDDKGLWRVHRADEVLSNVTANVQPASGRELQFVPEGQRTKEHVKVWFTDVVDTVNELLATKAAQLIYRNYVWINVLVTGDWRESGYVECLFQNTKNIYSPS